jgi:hypothetical protein
VQLNFGFDGTRPDIYRELRGDRSLAVKRRALENVVECGVNKLTIISTIANGVNDDNVNELMEFIHDYREHVSVWAFVPLTPCWESDQVKLEPTTTECVESIFENEMDGIEFVPTAMMKFEILSRFFGRQTVGGSHPNCESATLVVSDGEEYIPISEYLNAPLSELLRELRRLDAALVKRSAEIPAKGPARLALNVRAIFGTLKILGKGINLGKIFAKPGLINGIMAIVDLLRGRKIDRILRDRTGFQHILTLMTIPYEDMGGLEDARLHDCPAVFAYEDVDTGRIGTTAFCSWQTIKDEVCRKVQDHYDTRTARTKIIGDPGTVRIPKRAVGSGK